MTEASWIERSAAIALVTINHLASAPGIYGPLEAVDDRRGAAAAYTFEPGVWSDPILAQRLALHFMVLRQGRAAGSRMVVS
jgi:hypothetical protein